MSNRKASIVLNTASAFGLVGLLLLATGSGSKGGTDSDASSASSDTSEPKVAVSGKSPPNYEYIRGTCDNPKTGECDEYYGLIPKFAPDECKKEGGVFTISFPTPHPCPKANLVGTCHYVQSKAGDPGEFSNYYANFAKGAAAMKADCNTQVGSSKTEWIDPPAQPAAAASPSAGGSAQAKAATPAVKSGGKPPASSAKAKSK
jgi:hypothetical protein